jgi:hypothetical protein
MPTDGRIEEAGLRRRAAALLIDAVLASAISLSVVVALHAAGVAPRSAVVNNVVAALAAPAYFIPQWAWGQTIAMRLVGLELVRQDSGVRPGVARVALRLFSGSWTSDWRCCPFSSRLPAIPRSEHLTIGSPGRWSSGSARVEADFGRVGGAIGLPSITTDGRLWFAMPKRLGVRSCSWPAPIDVCGQLWRWSWSSSSRRSPSASSMAPTLPDSETSESFWGLPRWGLCPAFSSFSDTDLSIRCS